MSGYTHQPWKHWRTQLVPYHALYRCTAEQVGLVYCNLTHPAPLQVYGETVRLYYPFVVVDMPIVIDLGFSK